MVISYAVSRSAFFLQVALKIVILFAFCSPVRSVIRADDVNDGAEGMFCPIDATVDLNQASDNKSGFVGENGLFFPRDLVRFKDGVWRGCVCDVIPCLAICPQENSTSNNGTSSSIDEDQEFVNYSAIPGVYYSNLTIDEGAGKETSIDERFNILVWKPCEKDNSYYLEPEEHEGDKFYLLRNGSLFLPEMIDPKWRFMGFGKYCFKQRRNDSFYTPRICAPEEYYDHQDDDLGGLDKMKYVSGLIGVPFLIATVIIYSIIPELKNIHSTTLKCYLCCLIVAYVAFAIDRIPEADFEAGPFCLFVGFTIYFSFLASFFWLNVMCFDMWRRFKGFGKIPSSFSSHKERRKFLMYSIYAWGMSISITAFCTGMEFSPLVPESMIRPGFRMRACWFDSKSAEALYFYGPVALTIICNICFFILTTINVFKLKKEMKYHETSRLQQDGRAGGRVGDDNDSKHWLGLHVKLFIVMGISWSTEIISWLWKDPKYLWLVTDMVNALQGVLIFVIFVCKKSIWRLLKKRLNINNKTAGEFEDQKFCNNTNISLNSLPDLMAIQSKNEK